MKKLLWVAALIAGLGLMVGVPSGARADTMFTLGTGGTLPGLVNYGSVDVKTVSGDPNALEVVVTLSGTNHFASTGFDASFAFNLPGFGSITSVTGLPTLTSTAAAWSLNSTTAGSVGMDGAGTYQYGLDFSWNCAHGACNTDGNSLDFVIHATGIGSNTANVTGVAADVCTLGPNDQHNCSTGGQTGSVVGTLQSTIKPVPAPFVGAGLPGLIAACAGLVAFARRRRRRFA
jgi:hypothetical protein